jgi:SAM-dependent methyltransferase
MAQKISENKKYWTNFYKSFNEKNPSSFAIFCDTYFNLKNTLITDFGCGNGRDTIFFHNLGYKVWGVDEIIPKSKGYIFLKRDILDYLKHTDMGIIDGIAYCRFFFHAIDEKTEDIILDNFKNNFQMVMAEFRSDAGSCDGTHYRRLINGNKFLKKLISRGFKILYFNESRGFSLYGKEDPLLIRVVAKNENNIKS